jgi:predicted  nucleic acid-binding Zn-ribbon protein
MDLQELYQRTIAINERIANDVNELAAVKDRVGEMAAQIIEMAGQTTSLSQELSEAESKAEDAQTALIGANVEVEALAEHLSASINL